MSSSPVGKNHKNVIPFPSGRDTLWRVFDWTNCGSNPIEEWRAGLSDLGKEMFDGLLKGNRKIENPTNWVGFKRFMKGNLAPEKIFEFKFFADGKQYRVLCKCGDQRKHLIIVMGCYHKDSYMPKDALETAVKRSRAIGRRGVELIERPIPKNI
jgi:hypothetical protein